MMLWALGYAEAPDTAKCAVCETEWVLDQNNNLTLDFIEHNDKIDWKLALERMRNQAP